MMLRKFGSILIFLKISKIINEDRDAALAPTEGRKSRVCSDA